MPLLLACLAAAGCGILESDPYDLTGDWVVRVDGGELQMRVDPMTRFDPATGFGYVSGSFVYVGAGPVVDGRLSGEVGGQRSRNISLTLGDQLMGRVRLAGSFTDEGEVAGTVDGAWGEVVGPGEWRASYRFDNASVRATRH